MPNARKTKPKRSSSKKPPAAGRKSANRKPSAKKAPGKSRPRQLKWYEYEQPIGPEFGLYAPMRNDYRTMQHKGPSTVRGQYVTNPNRMAAEMVAGVATSHEVWETSLLMHVTSPMATYHLPGIDTTGTAYQPGFDPAGPWPGGRDTTGTSTSGAPGGLPQPSNMRTLSPDGTTLFQIRQVESDRQMESNYFRYDGWVLRNASLATNTTNEWNAVVSFNPLDPVHPITVLNWEAGQNPWASGAVGLEWTSTPFIATTNYQDLQGAQPWPSDQSVGRKTGGNPGSRDSSVDRWSTVSSKDPHPTRAPVLQYDCLNYYWAGGAELEVTLVGTNAFGAWSALARDDAHTVTRFWTTEDNPVDAETFDYGSTVLFNNGHNVAYASYTGSKWALSTKFSSFSDETAADRTRLALSCGYPLVHFKYAVSSAATTPYLQVKAVCWNGVAPTTLRFAGAAPFRTIPLSLPAWVSYCRARGATGVNSAAAQSSAARTAVTRISSIPSSSRAMAAAAANPKAAAKALKAAADTKRAAADVAIDLVSGVLPGVPRFVANGLGSVAKLLAHTLMREGGKQYEPSILPIAYSANARNARPAIAAGPRVEELD